jgi:hypothetical protein
MKTNSQIIDFLDRLAFNLPIDPILGINQRSIKKKKKMIIGLIRAYIADDKPQDEYYIEKVKELF